VQEFKSGHRTIHFNLCNLSYKNQSRFLQMCNEAVKNGVSCIKFVKTWNSYAQDISEHVFWHIVKPQEKFTERGK